MGNRGRVWRENGADSATHCPEARAQMAISNKLYLMCLYKDMLGKNCRVKLVPRLKKHRIDYIPMWCV